MARASAAAVAETWAFLPEPSAEPTIDRLRSAATEGTRLLAEIKRSPVFKFNGFDVDFTADEWDFSGVTDLNVTPSRLKARFHGDAVDDELKLCLVSSVVWQKAKVQSLTAKTCGVRKALTDMGLTPDSIPLLSAEAATAYLDGVASATSLRHAGQVARNLHDFLEFRGRAFGPAADPALVPALDRFAKDADAVRRRKPGWPVIPDSYLVPLVDTMGAVMADGDASPADRVTAAVTLLLSQTGLRPSEALGAVSGSLQVSKGACGEPDLAFMEYRSFKGAHGDGNSRIGRTIMNGTARGACLWLEENCAEARRRVGTDALAVYPRQKARFTDHKRFSESMRELIAKHHDSIPCLNARERYPDMNVGRVDSMIAKRSAAFLMSKYGLKPEDEVVYPVAYQFRVTVATKLYESGVDMHYIRKHMNHMDESVTAGYIRSGREVERNASELVYRAMLGDGARLIGPHASEFAAKVESYVGQVGGKVKGGLDEIVAAASERYPLRRKVGGVCIRCGNIVPCSSASETDAIFCAFGVCPNQCSMYFMADEALASAEAHMALVDENLARGHVKAAANELRKAQNVVRDVLLPQLDGLDEQLAKLGRDGVLGRFPNLEGIIDNEPEIKERIEGWTRRDPAA